MTPEQKKKWEDKAVIDKKRYEKEMSNYTPSEEFTKSKSKGSSSSGGGKQKRDPNLPKKPMSSYMLFSVAARPKLKEDNPDASFGELAKLVSAKYKTLNAEEKEKLNKKAAKAKEKYQQEMKEYKEKQKEEVKKESSSEEEDSDDDSSQSEDAASDDSDDDDSDSDSD